MLPLLDAHANTISAIGSVASALVAIVAAMIAYIAVKYSRQILEENRIMRLTGSDPEVIAYLKTDENVFNCLNIVVENVGNGPAFDVKFSVEIDENIRKDKSIMLNKQIGSIPFSVLSPNDRISTSFGMGFNLLSDPVLPEFTVSLLYKNISNLNFERDIAINVKSFDGIGKLSPEDQVKDISKSLSSISASLAKIADS